jgi:hypothetical protein
LLSAGYNTGAAKNAAIYKILNRRFGNSSIAIGLLYHKQYKLDADSILKALTKTSLAKSFNNKIA